MPDAGSSLSPLLLRGDVPLALKIGYSAFVCVLVPVYWRAYGPANFLWFSDIALFVTLAALWLECPLLVSMQAVSVLALEIAWNLDFLVGLVSGKSPVGLAGYMFDATYPLYLRGLSLFHVALPPLWIWLLYRWGYDGRALALQIVTAWIVLLSCYFFTTPKENINWVFGPGSEPQQWMPSGWYFAILMIVYPLCVYVPSHFILKALFGK